MDMGFGTWNVRSLYGAGSLETAVAVQQIRWDERESQPADQYEMRLPHITL
jgi:hypothetical protein